MVGSISFKFSNLLDVDWLSLLGRDAIAKSVFEHGKDQGKRAPRSGLVAVADVAGRLFGLIAAAAAAAAFLFSSGS